MVGKLGQKWNARMEGVHRTSALCNYLHWSDDFDILFFCNASHHLGEFEALGNTETDETKRASLLLGMKEAQQRVFIQLITQPGVR